MERFADSVKYVLLHRAYPESVYIVEEMEEGVSARCLLEPDSLSTLAFQGFLAVDG